MRAPICALLSLLLAACGRSPLPSYKDSGVLVVVTRKGATTYHRDASGKPTGFEYDLATLFAKDLGVRVRFVVVSNQTEVIDRLAAHQAHLAVAGLVPRDSGRVRFTDAIQHYNLVLVKNEDTSSIERKDQLQGQPIEFLAGSGTAQQLKAAEPSLDLVASPANSEMQLMERVADGKAALAVTDAPHFTMADLLHPNLDSPFSLLKGVSLVWAVPADDTSGLLAKANAFIARIRKDGTLARLEDRYFGHIHRLNDIDVADFLQRIHTVLPNYRAVFEKAQDETSIDWRLLAALSYQESHWNPLNTSPTGVRGMMMLTDDTADQLGVANRLDPTQSVLAGARYLASLKRQLPASVKEPDRMWMSIAAYNIGMGHMNGARAIARRLGRDPNSWYDMKHVLPLLVRPAYAAQLKAGAARGGEAVIMVENIRTYYDILQRYEPAYRPLFSSETPKNAPSVGFDLLQSAQIAP